MPGGLVAHMPGRDRPERRHRLISCLSLTTARDGPHSTTSGRPLPARSILLFGSTLGWSARLRKSPLPDSNRRPLPYHGSALPTELRGHLQDFSGFSGFRCAGAETPLTHFWHTFASSRATKRSDLARFPSAAVPSPAASGPLKGYAIRTDFTDQPAPGLLVRARPPAATRRDATEIRPCWPAARATARSTRSGAECTRSWPPGLARPLLEGLSLHHRPRCPGGPGPFVVPGLAAGRPVDAATRLA